MKRLSILFLLLSSFAFASQNDYVISNDTGANVRADINSALQADQTKNSGTSAPSTTYAFQFWMDTSGGTPILKMRNAANSAWLTIGDASLTGYGLFSASGGTVSGTTVFSNTDHIKLPTGTTAQRTGSPSNGMIRYNSDLKTFEGYHESQFSSFQREVSEPDFASNYSLSASVASNALTISLKTAAGANASLGDPSIFGIRNSTLASGDNSLIKVTGSLSGVVASGATLGHASGIESPIFVGVLNNAGTLELCWSTTPWDENERISTTAAGAGSTSASVIYSTTARTNVASKIVGKLLSTQTTAGTWAAVPTNVASGSAAKVRAWIPPTVQKFTSGSGTYTLPTAPRKPVYIRVRAVGGGSGGTGSSDGAGNGGNGGAGGNTTFGTSLIVANGGWSSTSAGATGGTASLGTGPIGTAISGGSTGGRAQFNNAPTNSYPNGANGANSVFGGAGNGGAWAVTGAGTAAVANSGSGGGGGAGASAAISAAGAGGAAGGFVDAIISNPSATYSYAVGAAGTAGAAGTNGYVGGAGGSGYIEVTEYYQ